MLGIYKKVSSAVSIS